MQSYAALINQKILVPSQRSNYVAVELHFLAQALQAQISSVYVDEAWYLKRYPDIASAIALGQIKHAAAHYQLHGYFEHRMPHEILVDEDWYLNEYPDIKKAVQNKIYQFGQQHFEELGYKEGRIPYPNFSLKTLASVL